MRYAVSKWIGAASLFVLLSGALCAQEEKGIAVVYKDSQGREVGSYGGSHALLIGVSDYTAGWPDLDAVPSELEIVEQALALNGFQVTKVLNPNGKQLEEAFSEFIKEHGYDPDNRLLFFYSGHGYTRENRNKGYLVPTDAPDPRKDERAFLKKALTMSDILNLSRKMEARHALFLFDSCFSGTIFHSKALPETPPHINALTSKPVRQFITAGTAGEEVPAKSVFTPCFVKALRGEADLTKDGFITGTELGLYLLEKVKIYDTAQTPQYGKIRDPELDEGDFVFAVTPEGALPFPLLRPKETPGLPVTTPSTPATVRLSGDIVLKSRPAGADVFLDDEPQPKGKTPLTLTIKLTQQKTKDVKVTFKFDGHKSETIDVTATRGDRVEVETVDLEESKLPGWLGKDCEIPEGDRDAYGNPIRKGTDPKTGWPFEIRHMATGMLFVFIAAGEFMMGSPGSETARDNDETQHLVRISRAFYLGKYEVTQAEWRKVIGTEPWVGEEYAKANVSHAATYISWEGCHEMARKLSSSGVKFSLPTEAQWEYTCRAGTTTAYSFGEDASRLRDYAWFDDNADDVEEEYAHAVGQKKPNAWGLYDMHGNVWEWCEDWYREYPTGSVTDPDGLTGSGDRVYRGGSWLDAAAYCRSANRGLFSPGGRRGDLGCRLALRSSP